MCHPGHAHTITVDVSAPVLHQSLRVGRSVRCQHGTYWQQEACWRIVGLNTPKVAAVVPAQVACLEQLGGALLSNHGQPAAGLPTGTDSDIAYDDLFIAAHYHNHDAFLWRRAVSAKQARPVEVIWLAVYDTSHEQGTHLLGFADLDARADGPGPSLMTRRSVNSCTVRLLLGVAPSLIKVVLLSSVAGPTVVGTAVRSCASGDGEFNNI